MEKMLKLIQGKKGMIASIIMTIVAYLGVKGLLGETEITMIGTIITIMFGTASYQTKKLYK